jgi:hypothetical protein
MECSKCKKTFSAKHRLKSHVERKVCDKKPKEKICPSCGQEFSSPQRCESHISARVCDKVTDNPCCPDCGAEFSTKQMLDYHIEYRVCFNWEEYVERYGFCNYSEDVCLDHGEPVMRCCSEKYQRKMDQKKQDIDKAFGRPYFDQREGVPWEDQIYWGGLCKYCGCERRGQHIWVCLKGAEPKIEEFRKWCLDRRGEKKITTDDVGNLEADLLRLRSRGPRRRSMA